MITHVVVDTDVVSFMFKWDTRAALYYGIPLVTHNRNHYVGVDGLSVISEAP
ncbi:MAG: hypothetical protein V7641_4107 [Blastocatellia bacterium]